MVHTYSVAYQLKAKRISTYAEFARNSDMEAFLKFERGSVRFSC